MHFGIYGEVSSDVLKVLKLHSLTPRVINFKTSPVTINHEMQSSPYDFLYIATVSILRRAYGFIIFLEGIERTPS